MPNLYPYQRQAVDLLHRRNGCAGLWMEMGTGKTRVALTYLQEAGAKRILIPCPISAVSAWRREIQKLRLDWRGLNLTKSSLVERERRLRLHGAKAQVVLVNYDVLWMPTASHLQRPKDPKKRASWLRMKAQKRLVERIRAWQPDSVVPDEIHRIKHRSSRQSRFLATVPRWASVKRRIGLSGTPITQGMEDVFAEYRFVDPKIFGTRWPAFEARYILKGGYFNHEIVGYQNVKELKRKVRESSFSISKSKALDLPPRRTVIVDVELEPKSRKRYEEFTKEALAEIEGLDEDGKPLKGLALARIVLTSLIRQRQLTSGYVNTDNGEIEVSDEKLRIAIDLTNDALANGQQVVIFCTFTRDIKRLAAKIKGSLIYSGLNKSQREHNRQLFQSHKCKVLLVQTAAGSESIDLFAGSVGIFYSYDYNLKDYAQARDRLHRHGQKRKVTYYILRVKRSADVKVFKALGDKQDIARSVGRLDYARRLLS